MSRAGRIARRPRRERRPPTWVKLREPDGSAIVVNVQTGKVEGRILYDFPGADALRVPVTPPAGYRVNP